MIGNGVVIDPAALLDEIEMLEARGHRRRRAARHQQPRARASSRSIAWWKRCRRPRGPVRHRHHVARHRPVLTRTRSARRGIRMADLLDTAIFEDVYARLAEDKQTLAQRLPSRRRHRLTTDSRSSTASMPSALTRMVCDTAKLLNRRHRDGQERAVRRARRARCSTSIMGPTLSSRPRALRPAGPAPGPVSRRRASTA